MNSKSLGFGVIGVGLAGSWYLDILKQHSQVALVAALRSPGGDTKSVQEQWGIPCITDLASFLALEGLDCVCIASPSGQHYAQAKAALEAGKHVLIEKPLTLDLAQARELGQLARRQNLRLGVTLQRRADPLFSAVKEAISSGAIGKPVLLTICMPYFRNQAYYDSAAWRGTTELDGGGILMNQGIHSVDLAVWWFGRARKVSAFSATLVRNIAVEDSISLSVVFEQGALGSISGTTASAPGTAHSLEICGSEGSLTIVGEQIVRWDVPGVAKPEVRLNQMSAASDPKALSTQNHSSIVADFVQAVITGREPLVNAEAASHSLELILAAYASARTGNVIELDQQGVSEN